MEETPMEETPQWEYDPDEKTHRVVVDIPQDDWLQMMAAVDTGIKWKGTSEADFLLHHAKEAVLKYFRRGQHHWSEHFCDEDGYRYVLIRLTDHEFARIFVTAWDEDNEFNATNKSGFLGGTPSEFFVWAANRVVDELSSISDAVRATENPVDVEEDETAHRFLDDGKVVELGYDGDIKIPYKVLGAAGINHGLVEVRAMDGAIVIVPATEEGRKWLDTGGIGTKEEIPF